MRYTEARLTPLGAILMEHLDQETVDFVPTYDEANLEPVVLPAACLPRRKEPRQTPSGGSRSGGRP
jgi:DNA gyrase/topoisomerase IV subunit A